MASDASLAQKCFKENLDLYVNTKTDPETGNLYIGLTNLAGAIVDIQTELQQIKQQLSILRRS